MHVIKAHDVPVTRLIIARWRQMECRHERHKHVFRKIGVEEQDCLTRHTEREFDCRKHDQALAGRQRIAGVVSFDAAALRTYGMNAMS